MLAACTPLALISDFTSDVVITNTKEVIEAADWGEAETFTIDIRQSEFRPSIVRILQGGPYIMVLENRDDVEHVFVAREFFNVIAVRKVIEDEKELPGGRLFSVRLEPGAITEVHFVPMRDGWFEFRDEAPSLAPIPYLDRFPLFSRADVQGTVGAIIVEE